jgi:hypothetical protein
MPDFDPRLPDRLYREGSRKLLGPDFFVTRLEVTDFVGCMAGGSHVSKSAIDVGMENSEFGGPCGNGQIFVDGAIKGRLAHRSENQIERETLFASHDVTRRWRCLCKQFF